MIMENIKNTFLLFVVFFAFSYFPYNFNKIYFLNKFFYKLFNSFIFKYIFKKLIFIN